MTRFLILDVFTDAPFGGNPLAVIPDATGLSEEILQRIAREFNFSESTFVYPPEDPAHTARVRIFTPTTELPFAGHPTVGTALALAGLGHGPEMVLELGVGPIPVTARDGRAEFTTRVPLTRGAQPVAGELAECLSLAPEAIRTDRHGPEMAGVGLTFCLVELADKAGLGAATPDLAAFRRAADTYSDRPNFGVFCYARNGNDIFARMFAPTGGIPEDPATGSASAALTAFLATLEGQDISLAITQGVEMGRPSRIDTSAMVENGEVTATTVAGNAVQVAEGTLTLP